MKYFLALVICGISLLAKAQIDIDTALHLRGENHFFNISCKSNTQLIVFLHGGVNNPYFKQSSDQKTLDYLIEKNTKFLQQAVLNNFDLIAPISNDSLNWLAYPEQAYNVIQTYIQSLSKKYREIYISVFSDGGTGSFKMFYSHSDYFSGLVVFNGYPQHSNFYKSVNYSSVTDKKVIFCSTYKDETIPYEFLLTEYCKQKSNNANTYFYLAKGKHAFNCYTEEDLVELFAILTNKVSNIKTEPIQGFVRNDQLIAIYPYRKKIVRKYHFGRDTYDENVRQLKKYKKHRE